MNGVTKRKRQLLSIVLMFCMVLTGITVERSTVKATTTHYASAAVAQSSNVYKSYYALSAAKKFTNEDEVQFAGVDFTSYTIDGKSVSPSSYSSGLNLNFPEGHWLISDLYNASEGSHMSIVSATVEPQVYLATNEKDTDGNIIFVKTDVGTTTDADGMASVTISETQDAVASAALTDEVRDFWEGLDISVRKSVNKLEKTSFKITVNCQENATCFYDPDFQYYTDANQSTKWTDDAVNCLNYKYMNYWSAPATNALGGIVSDNVKIYIVPGVNFSRLKASVDGAGGSISTTSAFYRADASEGVTCQIKASEGYKIKKLERYNAGATSVSETYTYNTKTAMQPIDCAALQAPKLINTAKLIAYFETAATTIANKNYQTGYTYGASIPAPDKANFTITRGDSVDASIEPTFTWYQGNYVNSEVNDADQLSEIPSAVGTYTLKVDVAAGNGYDAGSAKFLITIQSAGSSSGSTSGSTSGGTSGSTSGGTSGNTSGTTSDTTPDEAGGTGSTTTEDPTKDPAKNPTDDPDKAPTTEPGTATAAEYIGLSVDWQDGKMKLNWDSVTGADGFEIYAYPAEKKQNAKALNKTVRSHRSSAVLKKIYGNKISDTNVYRIQVKAFKLVDGEKIELLKSRVVQIAGEKHTRYTNVKRIRLQKTSFTLKPEKTAWIECKLVKENKAKELLDSTLCYTSSDKTVATVTKKGRIKAVGSGSCTITVLAVNGVTASIKVTVK